MPSALAMITSLHHKLVGPVPMFALAMTLVSLALLVAGVVRAIRSQRS